VVTAEDIFRNFRLTEISETCNLPSWKIYAPGVNMSRVINPNSAGKQRNQMMRAIAIALRELLTHDDVDDSSRDLAAFIAAALIAIGEGIETSLVAWEKRGYWLKADKFRLEWEWANTTGRAIERALIDDDWQQIALLCVKVGSKVQHIKLPKSPRIGTPWEGAWRRLRLGI
jgi:hypothetical protein